MTKVGDFVSTETAEEINVLTREPDKRITGKIIKVSEEGWGFISSKEVKFTRIFFHWTSLKQDTLRFPDLKNGMQVEFTPVEVPEKGYRAIKIKVIPTEQKSVN